MNTLPYHSWDRREMKSEITKYFELHKNENITYPNLCI